MPNVDQARGGEGIKQSKTVADVICVWPLTPAQGKARHLGWLLPLLLLRVDCLPRFYPCYLLKELRSRLEFRSGTPTILGGGRGDAGRTLIIPSRKSFGVDNDNKLLQIAGSSHLKAPALSGLIDSQMLLCFHFRCMHFEFFSSAKKVIS